MTVTRIDALDWQSETGPAAVVRRVAAAASATDGREPLNEAALLALAHDGLTDAVLLLAGEDGFAYVHGTGRPELELAVAPAARGRGTGAALLAGAVEAAGAPMAAWSHGNHPAPAALAARAGWRAVRELWLMRRPLTEAAPPVVPPGFAVRPFRPGEDDAGFLAVNAAAFSFHPEQGSLDQRGLDERRALDWFDPAGFLVATRDGAVEGFHWTKVHPDGTGEVYVLGVAPTAQGSGLGAALLAAGLAHLRSRGVTEVVLYVEADNAPAVRLYEGQGFTHAAADTDVMYELA